MARQSGNRHGRDFVWSVNMKLCLHDLGQLTGGKLRLASMPPREGELAAIGRIVLAVGDVCEGDLFWCLSQEACDVQLAFLRGALGVACAGLPIEPWPGRFSLHVDNAEVCLKRLIDGLPRFQQSSINSPELKVLQLCAARRVDIYPPTCGRSAKNGLVRRCGRRAA
jgi:hypothetical protein